MHTNMAGKLDIRPSASIDFGADADGELVSAGLRGHEAPPAGGAEPVQARLIPALEVLIPP